MAIISSETGKKPKFHYFLFQFSSLFFKMKFISNSQSTPFLLVSIDSLKNHIFKNKSLNLNAVQFGLRCIEVFQRIMVWFCFVHLKNITKAANNCVNIDDRSGKSPKKKRIKKESKSLFTKWNTKTVDQTHLFIRNCKILIIDTPKNVHLNKIRW